MVACRHPFLHHAAYPTTGVPAVVPFNSEYDERPTGYFGSMSRYLRTWLAVQVSPHGSFPVAQGTRVQCCCAWLPAHPTVASGAGMCWLPPQLQLRARRLPVRRPLLLPIATEEAAGPTAHPARLPHFSLQRPTHRTPPSTPQNCSAYPWPSDGVWSPGAANASVEPPPDEFKALKASNRAGLCSSGCFARTWACATLLPCLATTATAAPATAAMWAPSLPSGPPHALPRCCSVPKIGWARWWCPAPSL